MVDMSLLDRRTNEWLRGVTKLKDVVEEARKRKRTFAWKVARMENERWLPIVINLFPNAKRKQGRPKIRWQDEFWRKKATRNWTDIARNNDLNDWLIYCN